MIDQLVDRDYFSVSILEDMQQVAEWLQERDYFAVVDERDQVTGIITSRDLMIDPTLRILNINIKKPAVHQHTSLLEALKLMESSRCQHLPVYNDGQFIGIISLLAVTYKLLEVVTELKQKMARVQTL